MIYLHKLEGGKEGGGRPYQLVAAAAVQGSTNRRAPGCVNAAGNLRQKWQARAGTKFTKPGARLLVEPCSTKRSSISRLVNLLRSGWAVLPSSLLSCTLWKL